MVFLACFAPWAKGAVVINEIMYRPPGDLDQLQYVELFNTGGAEVDLSGWSFTSGVKFRFPAGKKLAGQGFLVVCRDSAAFKQHYTEAVALAGQFEGHLSHGRERLELSDADHNVVDSVKYSDSAPWPLAPDGHSASLERICPFAAGNDASNWAASTLPEIEKPKGTPGWRNDSFSPTPLPVVSSVSTTPEFPVPGQPVVIRAEVAAAEGIDSVTLWWRAVSPSTPKGETALAMTRIDGDEHRGRYGAKIPAQPEGMLVRYRIEAKSAQGATRNSPGANELRTAWSYSTFVNHNTAQVPVGYLWHLGETFSTRNASRFGEEKPPQPRGADAFIYMPPGGGKVQTFDFVQAPQRSGGYKVHFLKDATLRGMTGINLIFESSPRWVLAEPLAYEVYRLAGVPAEMTEHIRLSVDGHEVGYRLLIEQPNKSFLRQRQRDTSGNLYKLLWYGNGIVGQYEKKTNLTSTHEDLLAAIAGLNQTNPVERWVYIQANFNTAEFASYYAVNMCIQNWDGFHNNYFVYHDTGGTGRWEIYPWDEDKTWGDYDGGPRNFDWYALPLNYGMNGSVRPPSGGGSGSGPFAGWWRSPGSIAGPMLADPSFRQQFLARLRVVATTGFTEEKIFPLIDAMEKRLEPEIASSAQLSNAAAAPALTRFHADIQSFRNQVRNRRKFILAELDKAAR